MKAPGTVLALVVALIFLFVPQMLFGQTETLDIVSYASPQGWTKTPKDGAVTLSEVNKATNGFCVVTVYGGTPSAGSPEKDFANRWNELAVTPFKAEAKPKSESQIDEGWTTTSTAAAVEIDGIKSYVLLTVFTGYGKTASVFSILNDQAYLAQLDTFMSSIKLDKTKAAAKTSPPVQNNVPTSAAVRGSDTPGKFGHLIYKPMPGWKQKNYTNAVSFTPNYLSPEFTIEARIMESKPFSGSIQQAFDASWAEALQQLEAASVARAPSSVAFDDSPVQPKVAYQGWEYMNGNGYFIDRNNNSFYLDLFVIKLNNRIERMFVVAQQVKQTYGVMRSLNQYTEYNSVYNDFFYSVKFDDWKDKGASSGNLTGPGIVGLYAGFRLKADLVNDRSRDVGGLTGYYAALFSNGQVYYTDKMHPYGFNEINTQSEANLHQGNWGTYSIQNGTGNITMGPNPPMGLTVNNKGFMLNTQSTNQHQYIKIPSVDGAVFNGTYYFEGKFSSKVNPSVTFTPDGRFVDDGAVNILYHNFQERDALNIAAKPGSGTYQVKNFTVIFNYSDGRTFQIAFSGLLFDKNNPSPATLTLSFNNDQLLRK